MAFASDRAIEWETWLHRLGSVLLLGLVGLGAAGVLGDRASVVVRAAAIYLFLLIVFRIAGRRTLAQTTTFDLVLILVIGDATQQALLGTDTTMESGALAVMTLVSLDISLTHLKRLVPALDRLIEGDAVMLMTNGQLRQRPMIAHAVDAEDILGAARENHGLTDLADVREAVLEKDGKISIVPVRGTKP